MKTIADPAMSAIEAGEAIVTGAVEITPLAPAYSYETVDTIDIDAVANCAATATLGLTAGILLSGFDPDDVLRLTLPTGQTFTAWNHQVPVANRWQNAFDVIPGGVAANSVRLDESGSSASVGTHSGGFATDEEARAAFGTHLITGASDYTFYILDTGSAGAAPKEFWKIEFDHTSFPYNNFARAIEMFEVSGGSNVAIQGSTGTASGAYTGSGFAFDGNNATYAEWPWPVNPGRIVFEFDSARDIVEFSWKCGAIQAAVGPTALRLLRSSDGIDYDLVDNWTTSGTWADNEVRTFQVDGGGVGGGAGAADNSDGVSVLVEKQVSGGDAPDPLRLWGGHGSITFDTDSGAQAFTGIGSRALAQQNAGAVGGVAQGLTLSLSGVEPAALPLLDGNEVKSASVVLYRLIFAPDGKELLDAHVFDRGRVDTVSTDETIGSDAAINLAVESSARGLGRQGARQRADSDQRLINAADGYFKNAAFAGQKELYWGGKKPARVG